MVVMKLIEPTSVDDLKRLLAELGDNVLFRGQTSHYEKDGIPSIVTSFDRRGHDTDSPQLFRKKSACVISVGASRPSHIGSACRRAASVREVAAQARGGAGADPTCARPKSGAVSV